MSINEEPTQYMLQALQLASQGRYSVSPNPMVGCIIVKNDHVIGKGYHQHAGGNHAEIQALQAAHRAGFDTHDATAYVTLEPCCHFGRTPPCTQSLINAGIRKIYVATLDPNPLVSGKGVAALKNAGIEVEIGLLQTEATELNKIFFHYITHKRPFVIAKWAMSLDGKTITSQTDSRNISCITSQEVAHDIRRQVDAILIGANTALKDNPLLTARSKPLTDSEHTKQPIRIILLSQPLPLTLTYLIKICRVKPLLLLQNVLIKLGVNQ